MARQVVNPDSLPRPTGYSYAVDSTGDRTVVFSGHTAVDAQGQIVGAGDIVGQFEQTLSNLAVTATAAGLELSDVTKLTIYVTDIEGYQARSKEIGAVYRQNFGSHYPAMTVIEIVRLWDALAMIEIEAVAVP